MEGSSNKCSLNKIKVLVVDEDLESLKQTRSVLNACNYQVFTCGNARCALAILQTRARDFDFILLDEQVNRESGFVLSKTIKNQYEILVIMMTSEIAQETMIESKNNGVSQLVRKPIDCKTIESFLQHDIIKRHHKIHHNLEKFKELIEINNLSDRPSQVIKGKGLLIEKNIEGAQNDISNDEESNEENNDKPKNKKQKLWTPALEEKFQRAIDTLGGDGMPSIIMKLMNVEGLTRYQVASHLQKYRRRMEMQSNNSTNTPNLSFSGSVPVQSNTNSFVPVTTQETPQMNQWGSPIYSSFLDDFTSTGDLHLVEQPDVLLTPQSSEFQVSNENGIASNNTTNTGGQLRQEMDQHKMTIQQKGQQTMENSNRI